MSLLNDLFVDNPMLKERQRFIRRFTNFKGGGSQPLAFVIVLVVYFALLLSIASAPNFLPVAVLYVQLVLFCLLLPPILQGCIAGEREKGTWETLLAAPVSKAQIVVGKYMGGLFAILALTALMSPLLLWTNSGTAAEVFTATTYPSSEGPHLSAWQIFSGEALTVSFGLMLAAWCVLVSARSRRSFAAQGMIFGSLVLGLVVWPIVGGILGSGEREMTAIWDFLHPFCLLDAITARPTHNEVVNLLAQSSYGGLLGTAVYLGFTVTFLVWADRTLRFAEMDVRFLPRRHRAENR